MCRLYRSYYVFLWFPVSLVRFFFIKGNSYIEQKGKQKRVNLFLKKKKTFLLPMAEALKIIFKLFSVEQLCFIM